MFLSSFSIRRKIAAVCFVVALMFLGLKAYRHIGIDLLPKFDIPCVRITAVHPGASPIEMAEDVARRIEDAVASIEGLNHIATVCTDDTAVLTLEFVSGTDVDLVIHEVREKINSVMDDFPDGVETPLLDKVDLNACPVVTMHLTGTETLDRMRDYVDDKLADQFSCIPGVGKVRVRGGNEVQLHVLLDRDKLAACNISVAQVVEALAENNVRTSAGRIRESGRETTIVFDAEFPNIQALKELEIATVPDVRVYLGDVAEIQLISKDIRQNAFLDGSDEGVRIDVIKRNDADTDKVVRAVREKFDFLTENGMIPGGMRLSWFKDDGSIVREAVADAWRCVLLGIVLVGLLLLLFLRDARAAFIAFVSMPVSVVATFLAADLLNFSFDMTTLTALGCASGILAASSAIVIESIGRKLRSGLTPDEAARQGTAAAATAVSASALSNAVVFAPVAFMTTIAGQMVAPFAGVMAVASLAALFIAFTLTPVLATRLLPQQTATLRFAKVVFAGWDALLAKLENGCLRSIRFVRCHPATTLLAVLLLCAGVLLLAWPRTGFSFFPTDDRNELSVKLEFPSTVALSQTSERALEIVRDLETELPYLDRTSLVAGSRTVMPGQADEGVHLAEITLMFQPKGTRPPMDEIKETVREILSRRSDMLFSLALPQATGFSACEVAACLTGSNREELERFALMGADLLRESGVATDVDSSVRAPKPRILVRPDRPILKGIDLPASTLAVSLAGYFDGVERGSYKIAGRSYDIRIRTAERTGFGQIGDVVIGAVNGSPVNLDAIAHAETESVPLALHRFDKERAAWICANPASGYATSDVTRILKTHLEPQLPAGFRLAFFGQAEMMEEGVADSLEAILAAVVLLYLLLAGMTESWTRPLLILSSVPLGFVGLILAFAIADVPISMVGLIGAIMTIGVVVGNAILVMDECAELERSGIARDEAMIQAIRAKFRLVLMNTLASLAGFLPMAFGAGMGSEIRAACGIGAVGAIIFSACFTNFLLPALFFLFQGKGTRIAKNRETDPA